MLVWRLISIKLWQNLKYLLWIPCEIIIILKDTKQNGNKCRIWFKRAHLHPTELNACRKRKFEKIPDSILTTSKGQVIANIGKKYPQLIKKTT